MQDLPLERSGELCRTPGCLHFAEYDYCPSCKLYRDEFIEMQIDQRRDDGTDC